MLSGSEQLEVERPPEAHTRFDQGVEPLDELGQCDPEQVGDQPRATGPTLERELDGRRSDPEGQCDRVQMLVHKRAI